MQFTTEEFGDVSDIDANDLVRVLDEDAFGSFAVLSSSDDDFIQAGNHWAPGEACEAFLARHDSDPWILEYRDSRTGKQYQATRDVTLAEAKQAFLSYLRGSSDWRRQFEWSEIDV